MDQYANRAQDWGQLGYGCPQVYEFLLPHTAATRQAHVGFIVITTIDATKQTQYVYPCPQVRPMCPSLGEILTPSRFRFLPTRPSISTSSPPLPRPRSTGRLGSPLLTRAEIAPLRLSPLSRTATTFLGVPERLSMIAVLGLRLLPLLFPLALLPHLPTLPPPSLEAGSFPRRLPAHPRLLLPLRLKLVVVTTAPRKITRPVT